MNREEMEAVRLRMLQGETPSMEVFRDIVASLRKNRTLAVTTARTSKAKKEPTKHFDGMLSQIKVKEGK